MDNIGAVLFKDGRNPTPEELKIMKNYYKRKYVKIASSGDMIKTFPSGLVIKEAMDKWHAEYEKLHGKIKVRGG